jgi:acetyl-CoA carboxylase carboxyltransferase component
VQVRKAYGVAAAAHFGPRGTVLAWPSAESGALPIEGGVAVAFRRELAEADDPDALRAELEERLSRGRTPFPRAEGFGVHDLIDPRRTRPALCAWLEDERLALREHVARRAAALRS